MSLAVTVGIPHEARDWTPEAWQTHLDRHNTGIQLDSFDPVKLRGYLPCSLAGVPAGFEFYCDPTSQFLSEADHLWWWERLRLRRFDCVVELVTHSSTEERICALLGGAALADMVGGVFLENSMGKWLPGRKAVRWARTFAEKVR